MNKITNISEAYYYGRALYAQGKGIAEALSLIKSYVPLLSGYGTWAANDGYAHARRGLGLDAGRKCGWKL